MLSLLIGWWRLRRDGLPASGTLFHIRIIASRLGTVIPVRRGLGCGAIVAFDVGRWGGRNRHDRRRIVVGIRRVVVRPGVGPGVQPERVDDNADPNVAVAMIAMPMPAVGRRSAAQTESQDPEA